MKKLVVGNWKMYPTLPDSIVLATTLRHALQDISGVEVAIAPPTPWLLPISEAWKHKLPHLRLAAQNIWPDDQGAYTGEVSAYMLKNIVSYAIVGHSERRRYGNEDNELVGEKIQSCLRWGITPILCVGEAKKMVNAEGETDSYQWSRLSEQLLEGLKSVPKEKLAEVVIAYEPVWAVGSHNPAKPEYASQVIRKLRQKLADTHGASQAEQVRFIYGGSVTAENAGDYLRQSEIAGLLPGNVSVKAKDFLAICRLAATLG